MGAGAARDQVVGPSNDVGHIVQDHKPDGDGDDPEVERPEESGPAGLDAGGGFMDGHTGQLNGDLFVAFSARGLQVVGMNRRGRIRMGKNPVRPVA